MSTASRTSEKSPQEFSDRRKHNLVFTNACCGPFSSKIRDSDDVQQCPDTACLCEAGGLQSLIFPRGHEVLTNWCHEFAPFFCTHCHLSLRSPDILHSLCNSVFQTAQRRRKTEVAHGREGRDQERNPSMNVIQLCKSESIWALTRNIWYYPLIKHVDNRLRSFMETMHGFESKLRELPSIPNKDTKLFYLLSGFHFCTSMV
mmetsp:Transcript_80522/g.139732  ORF Transcript_80522/g.139732 Transcript_80522/m.139732 type:complete len:202 (+) Transcript_80522:355-960(+)